MKSTTTTTNANETVPFIQQYHQKFIHVLPNFYCVLLRQLGRRRYSPITFLHSRHVDRSLHTAEGRKLQYLQFSYLWLTLVGFTCSFPRAHAMFLPCNSLGSKNRFNNRTAKIFSGITCMNRFFYLEEILKNALLPFVNATFPDNKFQQDNNRGKAHKKVIFI